MTQATGQIFATARAGDARVIAGVSAAHFVSHFYMLVLPPLFAFVREDYGVSYVELGLALTVFNVVSAVLQTPAGFLIDRIDARHALVAGLLLGAAGYAVAAAVDSFWVLVAMFALIGVGNTVYHPADYAIMSHRVSAERMGQAYSIHTFAGILGSAAAPMSVLLMHSYFGWRGAFFGAAALGTVVAVLLLMQRDAASVATPSAKPNSTAETDSSWRLLLSRPILVSLVFFMLISAANGGLQNFSVVALGALYGTAPLAANTALTGNLLLSATGVLIGGWIASRTLRHRHIAAYGLVTSAVAVFLIGLIDPNAVLLVALMSLAGFASGVIMPARDLLVRAVTPPGAFGKVFGFVTNGFNISGIISPLIFGALMDHGTPRAVFVLIGVCSLAAILTVFAAVRKH
ncbi:MAG TPA: MFS transporter [Xanthobacteraceae bacterium]|nr:MFS transporter [Xanthobacteraceae bacterium]